MAYVSSGFGLPGTGIQQQSDFLLQVGQTSLQLAEAMYQWGQQVYAKTAAITDEVVDQAIAAAAAAGGFAAATMDRYSNVFQPLEDQLIHDANTYASDSRISSNMGHAEAASMQGSEAGMRNAERDLQGFGIDPSSGRYADLIEAARTNAGAAAAAAGEKARIDTENTGRALRADAIKVGEQYPKNALGALQTGIQGLNAASSANVNTANAGANLMKLPADYLSAAMQLKYPPTSGTSGGGASGGGSGTGKDPFPSSNPSWGDDPTGTRQRSPSGGTSGSGLGAESPMGPAPYDYSKPSGPSYSEEFRQTTGGDDPAGNDWGYYGDLGYDPMDPYSGLDNTSQQYGDVLTDSGYYNPGYDSSGFDQSSTGGMWTGADQSGGASFDDYGSGYSDYGDSSYAYAKGGPIQGQQGGMIPTSASPSGGRRQDDVQINAQPNEFVIPRDVALWKGQEFFQKMIMQSRQNRLGAPAHGTKRPMGASR